MNPQVSLKGNTPHSAWEADVGCQRTWNLRIFRVQRFGIKKNYENRGPKNRPPNSRISLKKLPKQITPQFRKPSFGAPVAGVLLRADLCLSS